MTMNQKWLTITIPSYNAEQYLETCLRSVCDVNEKTRRAMEVLVIDDGSTDGTRALAEDFAARYPDTVKVISKENGGHGSAVNTGISHATGRYFKVVDADDWVGTEALERLVHVLETADEDIVYTEFLWAFDDGSGETGRFRLKAESKEPFCYVMYDMPYRFDDIADRLYIKMHNMTIRTELLQKNSIRLDEHCFYVDLEYITYPIPYVQTIRFLNETVYYYRLGREGQSVQLKSMQKRKANYDKVLTALLRFHRTLNTSAPKQLYIARIAARAVAGEMKLLLSFPASKENRARIIRFDRTLKNYDREVYEANRNKAVKLLRASNYRLYGLMSAAVRMLMR